MEIVDDCCFSGNTFKCCGQFGQSKLYQCEQFNFHPRAIEILCKSDKLQFKSSDILLTMFPKSGSTWLSECIYLIVNQYQYELASKQSIEYRFPQIDSPTHDVFDLIVEQGQLLASNDNHEQCRMIKSSVPASLLVERRLMSTNTNSGNNNNNSKNKLSITTPSQVKPRVVSIFRNPRDVLVSFYHHCKTVKHYDIDLTFDSFYESFVTGNVPCGPIWLMYNEMYQYYCDNRDTTLIIKYEDMKRNLSKQINVLCLFLKKSPPKTDDDWSQLMEHLSVDRMRNNKTINRHDWTQLGLRNKDGFEFVRKGQVNDWKNYFNLEQSQRFDREITAKLMEPLQQMYPPCIVTD